jgi:hypothetical protein
MPALRERDATVSGARAALVAVGVCLLTVLIAWAALIGPSRVFTGPGPTPSTVTTSTTESAEEQDTLREKAERSAEQAEAPLWLKVLVWTFEGLVLLGFAAVVLLALRAARQAWRNRPSPDATPREDADFSTLDEPARIEEAVREDAAAQDAALAAGTPRNAIVAAWHRFELQGERAGVRRRTWETSSEFALRMLERAGADSSAVTRLAELYREARFSEHELGEADRQAALAALTTIRSSLGGAR